MHILTNLRKAQHRTIPATHNEFRGCRHHQAFPETISMTTEESRAPCNRSHQFQGCPLISLPVSPPVLPSLKPPTILPAVLHTHQASNPPHCFGVSIIAVVCFCPLGGRDNHETNVGQFSKMEIWRARHCPCCCHCHCRCHCHRRCCYVIGSTLVLI